MSVGETFNNMVIFDNQLGLHGEVTYEDKWLNTILTRQQRWKHYKVKVWHPRAPKKPGCLEIEKMGEEVGGMDGARISRGVTTTVRRRWCYWRRPHQKVETSIFFLLPSLIFHLLNPQNHPSKQMYFPPAICHLLLCHPVLLLPPIPPSIRVFSLRSWTPYCQIQTTGIHPDKPKIQKDTCTPMFIVALFTIAKTWKQPKM